MYPMWLLDQDAAFELKQRLDGSDTRCLSGVDGLLELTGYLMWILFLSLLVV